MFGRVKLGLALGAGGARGLAHIGVLKALEEAGIKISFLSGCSIGALVGGVYASCLNAAELENRLQAFLESDLFRRAGLQIMKEVFHDKPEGLSQRIETFIKKAYVQTLMVTRSSILETQTFRTMLDECVPDVNIEDLPLPFCAVSTDLRSGRPVLFRHGPLREAVLASVSIPGVVSPFPLDNLLLTDGGVLNRVPVIPLFHMGAEVTLAVDVELDRVVEEDVEFKRGIDILFRSEDIEGYVLKESQLNEAHLVIRPEVGHIHWSDFSSTVEMIHLGRDEVHNRLDEIRHLAQFHKWPLRRKERVTPLQRALHWIEI
ncbi:MAG: patatin-like phospholipase family protein [Candidatus Adiutricales bacterium]